MIATSLQQFSRVRKSLTYSPFGRLIGDVFAIIGEGEIFDTSKPGEVMVIKPGDIIHVHGNTNVTWSASTPMKGKHIIPDLRSNHR